MKDKRPSGPNRLTETEAKMQQSNNQLKDKRPIVSVNVKTNRSSEKKDAKTANVTSRQTNHSELRMLKLHTYAMEEQRNTNKMQHPVATSDQAKNTLKNKMPSKRNRET